MKFLKKTDAEKFAKLQVSTILELATLAPSSYEDYRLYSEVIESAQILDVTIERVSRTPKSIQVRFFAHNLGFEVTAVYFKPKPYIARQFVEGERNYYYAKVEFSQGSAQVMHPKKVTQIGGLTPVYKSALRADVMRRLMQSYIIKEHLLEERLPSHIVDALLHIHHPNEKLPLEGRSLSQESLYALKFTELYDFMQRLHKKRRYFKNELAFECEYESFATSLPFTLTDEQRSAIEDIRDDFSRDVASKRMIVGDVGSGKTMVILASAYMIAQVKERSHSILMAPTTILANQLFEEAEKFLPSLKVALVTNRTSKKLNLEEYDFIIGTHALLYRDLPAASLVMVDEQHRFGTMQRASLEKLVMSESSKHHPHYIQFSATPIPRTQAMIDAANVDVSLITSTPFKKDINSRVIHKSDFKELLSHIKSEIESEKQVLLIYPLVEESEMMAYQSISEARAYWEKNFEAVYVTHGKDKNKEDVLLEFREQGKILIATTVVEVGISLPRLSTIVIVGAERLGLSTLHQLRGRVSRTGLKGYCYLFTHQEKSARLEQFCETTNGFDIAQLDLKFRQSGDLLTGKNQSGKKFQWINIGEDVAVVKDVKNYLHL